MERHTRWLGWESEPIAGRMSFSSFSHTVDDIWAHDIERPYQIVLLPGYRVPEDLDRGSKDSLWFHKESVTDRPEIVWDGFSATALFEIIRECFDYSGENPFIKVREVATGKVVKDLRDPDILALRPRREAGWGPRKIRNHIVELWVWSRMFPSSDVTNSIYSEMVSSHGARLQESIDSYERAQLFMMRDMHKIDPLDLMHSLIEKDKKKEIRLHRACVGGGKSKEDSARIARDNDVEFLDTTYMSANEVSEISVADFPDGAPASFYRFATQKGRKAAEVRRAAFVDKASTPAAESIKPKRKWPWQKP